LLQDYGNVTLTSFIRDFPFDLINRTPAWYTVHDTQVLHPMPIALVINLLASSVAQSMLVIHILANVVTGNKKILNPSTKN